MILKGWNKRKAEVWIPENYVYLCLQAYCVCFTADSPVGLLLVFIFNGKYASDTRRIQMQTRTKTNSEKHQTAVQKIQKMQEK